MEKTLSLMRHADPEPSERCTTHAVLEQQLERECFLPRGGSWFDKAFKEFLFLGGEDRPELDFVVSGVVVLNTIVIILEVDLGPRDPYAPIQERLFWVVAESLFIVFYTAEVLYRIYLQRCNWVRHLLNWVDAGVVIVSATDCWVFGLLLSSHSLAIGQLMFIRLARLVRLLRLLRLMRLQGIYIMAMALWSSMASLVWIAALMGLGLLVWAVVGTVVIGHDDSLRHLQVSGQSICTLFDTVPGSAYTLFELLSLSDWHEIARPLSMERPAFCAFFLTFIVIFNFCLLNMFVGITVERSMTYLAMDQRREEKVEHLRQIKNLANMRRILSAMDATGRGVLQLSTFQVALEDNASLREVLRDMQFPISDASELFSTLSVGMGGELTVKCFVEGIAQLHGTMSSTWNQMATCAGVRFLVRRLMREDNEANLLRTARQALSVCAAGTGASTVGERAHRSSEPSPSSLQQAPTPSPSSSSAPASRMQSGASEAAWTSQRPAVPPGRACSKPKTLPTRPCEPHAFEEAVGLRILELFAAQREERERMQLEISGRLTAVEAALCSLQQPAQEGSSGESLKKNALM